MKKIILSFLSISLALIVHSQNPGNIGTTNLTGWFKPDALAIGALNNWTTTFPTGGGAITLSDITTPFPIVTNTPTAYTSNYNHTIDFTGNATGSDKVLENNTLLNLLNNNTSTGTGTMLCVYYLPVGRTGHMVMYREGTSGSVDGIQFRNLGVSCRLALGTTDNINGSRDYTESRRTELISYHGNKSGAGTMSLFQKSRLITGGIASSTTGDLGLYFGARKSGTFNGHFDGYLSEVIFYNQNLTPTEYQKVNTYLAVKYGITIDNFAGGIAGDYVATDGRLIWDADFSSTYHKNIIGIGRDNNEALLQKQSHQFEDTTRLYISTLQTNNDDNTGTFTNDISYVMLGDNRGIMCEFASTNNEQPNCGLYRRINREWKLTKTNFSQSFNTDITLSACASPATINASEIKLLVDDDGDFSTGSTQTYYNGDGTGIVITYTNPTITISNLSNIHFPNDSTKFFTIIIRPIVPDTIDINSCTSYTSPSGRFTWTTSGLYADTLTSSISCDSVIMIDLNLGSSINDTIYQTICSNQSYLFNGINRNTSGVYLDTFNLGICDSFATLILSVNNTDTGAISQNICSNQSYLFNGINLNTAGTYRDTLLNRFGCDSTVTLYLTIKSTSTRTINATICSNQSYLFNGINRNTSGIYLDTFINSVGCDSVVTLNLTVNPTNTGTINASICSNQFYLFNGVNRNTTGTYIDTFASSNGCDSVVTLNLTVNPTTTGTINATICSNQFYLFNGVNRNTTGTYIDTFASSNGCDSVVTLNLTVNPTAIGTINQSICNGQTYLFNGLNQSTSGTYRDTLIALNGCDSVVSLILTVIAPSTTTINQNICNGFTYLFNGINLATSGIYKDTFTNIIGCDSIVTLNLFVSPRLSGTINTSRCNGQTYLFNGVNLTTAGTYEDTLISVLGCDSFVTLNLSYNSIYTISIYDTLCEGESIIFNSSVLDSSGIYTANLSSIYGCDSTINLNLLVYPKPNVKINSGNDTTITAGESIRLVASGAYTYFWYDASTSAILSLTPTIDATYFVIGTDSNLCENTDTINVYIKELKDTSNMVLPSAFSPNGDGINDIFKILKTYNFTLEEFTIFNRWGEMIFSTNDIEVGWDGKFRERMQAIGTYVYYITGKSIQSKTTRTYTGTVTLIR
jgi:gliding motility-associated-like protein